MLTISVCLFPITHTPIARSLVQTCVSSLIFSLLSAKVAALGPPVPAEGIKSALAGITANVPL